MNHFVISASLVFICSLPVSVYFLSLRKRKVDHYFGLFWLSVAFWTCFVGFQFRWLTVLSDFMWGWLLHLGCISVPVLFAHFTLYLTDNRTRYAKALKLIYTVAAIFIGLNTVTNLFTSQTIYRDYYAYPKPEVLYPLYITFFQAVGLWTFILILEWRSRLAQESKPFVSLFLLVHVLAYLGCMDNFLIMYEHRIFPLYPYGLYLLLPYVVIGSFAFLRLQTNRSKPFRFEFGKFSDR